MTAVHHLSIDIETYSSEDITKSGLYRYAQSPDFQILLLAYSLDGGPVAVVDFTKGECIPAELFMRLIDPNTIKHAYNAAFEWYCLSRYLQSCGYVHCYAAKGAALPPEAWLSQWHCTMLHGMYCGYPSGLAAAGRALGLPEDKRKLATGKALIQYFCKPCAPTKTNGGRTRNLPHHAPEKWTLFVEYNRQDVVTEMEIERRLSRFPVPDAVQAQWVTDQIINARGVAVDMEMVNGAMELDERTKARFLQECMELTGLANPKSQAQMKQWLTEQDTETPDLKKATVKELLSTLPEGAAKRALLLRQELSKTSTAKYKSLSLCTCQDGRVRGLLQFYGAKTGRWAGRLVQPQNLPRTYIKLELLPLARTLTKQQNGEAMNLIFGSVADTLSQLIRTAFVASPGRTLVDADFSAIEARVIAWLAGEEWVLEVFRTHGKIYEATASQLYGVPIERIKKGNPEYALRQKGKAATLALGYGGGTAALITAGGLAKDTPEEELLDIRDRWREKNPAIQRFWKVVEAAAFRAFDTGQTVFIRNGTLAFARECDPLNGLDFLTITLPNGRKLYYVQPHRGTNRFGQSALCYWGQNQTTKKWKETETWGGTLAENITQAVARDCLAEAIDRLEAAGYPVVFHIHDEVVIDTDREPEAALQDVIRIMSQPPAWAPDLPLNADGWTGDFFRKD